MKKILSVGIILTVCATLCGDPWLRSIEAGSSPAEVSVSTASQAQAEVRTESTLVAALTEMLPVPESVMKEEAPPSEATQSPEPNHTPEAKPITTPAPPMEQSATQRLNAVPTGSDRYHTDVYQHNVYSEELIYDKDGNLIGKTVTTPTEFGPDAIWIDGRAYYDVPGFGLVEWSGPGQRTEDYTMYESGVKVGIMGGEEETPVRALSSPEPQDWPALTGEVIDQTVSTVPERSSTTPDYKPELTPPDDPNARIIP